ncbi:hypothetical protein PbJCM13498_24900 [Prolixibacter bellariivorans]|uniref:Outer membrane protein beta-barrel domain-containing protein n=3 Tax=Prolixibacter bellariivorans TaxID=314319 RepID=A0A5M4B1Y1_9BACT|nr:hypothetical protein PbJCM13498_24900 [Prolixibacter bellariivorans]
MNSRMNKKFLLLALSGMLSFSAMAQTIEDNNLYVEPSNRTPEPFLFSVSTLTPDDHSWSVNYSSSYGKRSEELFGYDGVGQQFALKGYLGHRFTLNVNAALGFQANQNVVSSQQVEIIRDVIGGKKVSGLRLGIGLGLQRDFSSVTSALSRITASWEASRWNIGGNVLLGKAFSSNRDKIDILTSLGVQYQLLGSLYGGVEAVGEDLEGLWDPEEAEGGAKILVGPSLNLVPSASRFSFSLSGGPVMFASRSNETNPAAIRELPSQAGLMVRARIVFNLSGS